MKFKLDENLPCELVGELALLGHETQTVAEEGLTGSADSAILAAATAEGRVLLTLDKGIASLRDYVPSRFSGIVLFRPDEYGRGSVLRFIRERLPELLSMHLPGRLIVVSHTRMRIRS